MRFNGSHQFHRLPPTKILTVDPKDKSILYYLDFEQCFPINISLFFKIFIGFFDIYLLIIFGSCIRLLGLCNYALGTWITEIYCLRAWRLEVWHQSVSMIEPVLCLSPNFDALLESLYPWFVEALPRLCLHIHMAFFLHVSASKFSFFL